MPQINPVVCGPEGAGMCKARYEARAVVKEHALRTEDYAQHPGGLVTHLSVTQPWLFAFASGAPTFALPAVCSVYVYVYARGRKNPCLNGHLFLFLVSCSFCSQVQFQGP